jgi:hypothetical protein
MRHSSYSSRRHSRSLIARYPRLSSAERITPRVRVPRATKGGGTTEHEASGGHSERDVVLDELRDLSRRWDETTDRHREEMWELRDERTKLLLRGVGAGLTGQQMADALTIQARVEGLVDEGISREGAEHLGRQEDRRHTQETYDAEAAAWRVRRDALEARARALMEWVKAEGDGVRLEYEQRAREIVEHVEGLKLPMNPETVHWVADRLGGYPNGIAEPERPQSGDQVGWAKYRKRLRAAREPTARRVIVHVTGERPGVTPQHGR